VAASTLLWPFETRETVCGDTPACRATSAIDGRAALMAGLSVAVMLVAAPAARSGPQRSIWWCNRWLRKHRSIGWAGRGPVTCAAGHRRRVGVSALDGLLFSVGVTKLCSAWGVQWRADSPGAAREGVRHPGGAGRLVVSGPLPAGCGATRIVYRGAHGEPARSLHTRLAGPRGAHNWHSLTETTAGCGYSAIAGACGLLLAWDQKRAWNAGSVLPQPGKSRSAPGPVVLGGSSRPRRHPGSVRRHRTVTRSLAGPNVRSTSGGAYDSDGPRSWEGTNLTPACGVACSSRTRSSFPASRSVGAGT
jgi:hypothetical protein